MVTKQTIAPLMLGQCTLFSNSPFSDATWRAAMQHNLPFPISNLNSHFRPEHDL